MRKKKYSDGGVKRVRGLFFSKNDLFFKIVGKKKKSIINTYYSGFNAEFSKLSEYVPLRFLRPL